MRTFDEQQITELERRLAADDIEGLWIVFHDYSARACAKWIPRDAFASAVRGGGVFAKANLNFTIDDQQAPDPRFGADTGDFFAVPDPSTYAPVPYRDGIGRVLSYLQLEDGSLWNGCPRGRLDGALDALSGRGLSARVAFEPEFSLFERTPDGRYEPADAFAMYSVDRIDANAALLSRIRQALDAQGVRVIQIGTEYGPGQLEINLHHEHPTKAADDLVTFRETVKALARDAGMVASFMPKPFETLAGSGVHVHLSLWDRDGSESRSEGDGPLGLSRELASFMAGVLAHAPAICGVGAPTVNSYKRLLPDRGRRRTSLRHRESRHAGTRAGQLARRIEFRPADHTANPYLLLTR